MTVDLRDEQVREVYAQFGLAVYFAQVLEEAIVNVMVASRLPHRATIRASDIDALMSRKYQQTLGALIRDLKRENTVPDEVEWQLGQALRLRNALAHGFFRDRVVQLCRPDGSASLLAELESIRQQLEDTCAKLGPIVHGFMAAHGITQKDIDREMDDLLADPSTPASTTADGGAGR